MELTCLLREIYIIKNAYLQLEFDLFTKKLLLFEP